MLLRGWLVGNGLGGDEIDVKARGVRIEQLLDAFRALGLQDEADVMISRDTAGDFRIGVGGSIRMLLASERKNDSGIIIANRRKLVRLIPCPNFQARPFAPE